MNDHVGKTYRLIKMRNPWSTEKYAGDASDIDKNFWTNFMQVQIPHIRQDDGCFWITVEEFHKTMLYIVVSYYHEDWWHNYIRNQGDDGKEHTFLFDIDA